MQWSGASKTHLSHKCRIHLITTKNLSSSPLFLFLLPPFPFSFPFSHSHIITSRTEIPLVPKYQNQLQAPLLFGPSDSHLHSWNSVLKWSLVAAGQRQSMKKNIKWDLWVLWKLQMPAKPNHLWILVKHRAPPTDQTMKGEKKGKPELHSVLHFHRWKTKQATSQMLILFKIMLPSLYLLTCNPQNSLPWPPDSVSIPTS